ncbi:MAG: thiamine-phosphate kinase [Thaumarchaeota archaeon]|jgi:thiamine-monophosphate kinase|nr:thiamine-phosphate kinase [Nitrososphaerota archaeon]MBT5843224.1 thiamine-phosphate kinase [Nitrososphaerota archaeon]MBT6469244.1 thiamine-phosphate kinase [Nitrososphaerota archaeon]
MKKLNEASIIEIFQKSLGKKKFVSEDVEFFNIGKTRIFTKIDTLVQSTDIPPKMKLSDASRKSIVACISDFAAKGIKPKYGVISINLPKSISRSKIDEIVKGFKKASKEFDIEILGGDTNEGKEIVLNVCIFGESKDFVSRKGSKEKDIIFVTGPFGYTALGLKMILEEKQNKVKIVKKSINIFTNPKPRLVFGVKNKKYFSSSMDSSDGLSTTLNEMSKQSKKKFVINNIPSLKDLEDYVEMKKLNLKNLVFHGGEEYEFVFTVSPKNKQMILKNSKKLKTPIIEIGYVTSGKGVFLQEKDNQVRLKDFGWKHFK